MDSWGLFSQLTILQNKLYLVNVSTKWEEDQKTLKSVHEVYGWPFTQRKFPNAKLVKSKVNPRINVYSKNLPDLNYDFLEFGQFASFL